LVSIAIGINGSVGSAAADAYCRVLRRRAGITVAAINDIAPVDRLAYGLRRDSIRGAFPGTVTAAPGRLIVNDQRDPGFNEPQPERIPWADAGVDVVIEATGRFRAGARPAPTSPTAAPARS
jgi:glyceraldehyde 3-phosphate dehydrogenase